MTLKLSELTFNKRDEFAREQVAENVIKLLKSDIDISPMVIDGDWGTGKTEFCHKLINKMESEQEEGENFKLLYIDAFQADHADNPLMTILAAVLNAMPDNEQKSGLLEKALPVVRFGLSTLLKAASGHVLKANADEIAGNLEKHLEDAADKAIDTSVTALLKDHEEAEKNLEALQKMLEEIAKDSPLVLFIDELDRCRPDFSVQMLEVIKHTFDVPGVQFVLVTNKKQLRAAINNSYGSQVDAQRYLDKFLKFSFQLVDTIPKKLTLDGSAMPTSEEHYLNLLKKSETLKESCLVTGCRRFITKLIKQRATSLREIETFVRHCEVYQSLSDGKGFHPNIDDELAILRILGVYIFCLAPELSEAIDKSKLDATAIMSYMGLKEIPDLDLREYKNHCEILAVLLAKESAFNSDLYPIPDKDQERWKKMKRDFQDHQGKPEYLQSDIRHVIKLLKLCN